MFFWWLGGSLSTKPELWKYQTVWTIANCSCSSCSMVHFGGHFESWSLAWKWSMIQVWRMAVLFLHVVVTPHARPSHVAFAQISGCVGELRPENAPSAPQVAPCGPQSRQNPDVEISDRESWETIFLYFFHITTYDVATMEQTKNLPKKNQLEHVHNVSDSIAFRSPCLGIFHASGFAFTRSSWWILDVDVASSDFKTFPKCSK